MGRFPRFRRVMLASPKPASPVEPELVAGARTGSANGWRKMTRRGFLTFGSAISLTTYAELFRVIITLDIEPTFNLPDLRGRIRTGSQ